MAIRERVRRALHKSESTSSIEHTESNTTTSSSSRSSVPSIKEFRLTKTFTWHRESKPDRAQEKETSAASPVVPEKKKKRRKGPIHPSERPLTEQNLQHMAMLDGYTFTFGRTNRPVSLLSGISPGCSRRPSVDLDGPVTPAFSPGVVRENRSSFSVDAPRVMVTAAE